jgi:hypothetical protein
VGIPSWMGFEAFIEPFFTTSSFFSPWNSSYQEAFLTNFFFFHDGILAIRKPFTQIFFSPWDSVYQEAFHTNFFFFFHDGILAIRKPFIRTFLFS